MRTQLWLSALLVGTVLSHGDAAWAQTYSKTERITYHDNTSAWVLGQTESTQCVASVPASPACDGDVVSATSFDPTYALPIAQYAFGKLKSRTTYDTESQVSLGQRGSVATISDGNGNVTRFSSWSRGIPQKIEYANGTSQLGAVDDVTGLIRSVTDENGYQTRYAYDAAGRLSRVDYPEGDPTAWAATTSEFVQEKNVAEYGLAAGHWRETVQTGKAVRITYFDALWRPVLVRQYDASSPSTSESFVRKAYDDAGMEVFSSYPSATSAPTLGVWTSYDSLGRPVSVAQDTELSPALQVTRTEYLPGFITRVTNPRGFSTSTSFLTYDQPTTDWPVEIAAPENQLTRIDRDPHGRPAAITRQETLPGSTLSATRKYVYDDQGQLCKTLNPESGATIVAYDGAGNISWSAEGLGLTGASCDRELTTDSQRVTRTYDKLNRLLAVATPGGTADLQNSYYPDGKLESMTVANPGGNQVTTSYLYNRRRLLTAETSINGATQFGLGYDYDVNGSLAALTYPDGHVVSFQPDAFGRATRVTGTGGEVYARDIHYTPGGAISDFVYGNGIQHVREGNVRQMPSRSLDSYVGVAGEVKVLDDRYAYDANGNVASITDAAQAGLTSRTMGYDGLDRLTSANSPQQWGSATYVYDPLDNLRIADQGARKYRYNYDANNRLASITNPAGALLISLGYDSHGNTTSKNGQAFVFDAVNRMSQVTGSQTYRYDGAGRRVQTTDADGKTTFWIYSQSGQVLYTSEARRSQNLAYIYLGNTQVATRAVSWGSGNATIRFQHTDSLGSPVAETDALRAVVRRISYTPYGETFGPSTVDGTGYTGHVMDQATGLTYMQQRYYDPTMAQFLGSDPSGVDSTKAHNFVRYSYAADNPYRFFDPDGRDVRAARASGMAAADMVVEALRVDGFEVYREVAIRVEGANGKTVTAVADYVYRDGNKLVFGEVKAGMHAKLSMSQRAVYGAIEKGGVKILNSRIAGALGVRALRALGPGSARMVLHAAANSRAWGQGLRYLPGATMTTLRYAASTPVLVVSLLVATNSVSAMERLRDECPQCAPGAIYNLPR